MGEFYGMQINKVNKAVLRKKKNLYEAVVKLEPLSEFQRYQGRAFHMRIYQKQLLVVVCFLWFPRTLRCKNTSALPCWITCFGTFADGLLVWNWACFVVPTLISIIGDTLITELFSSVQISCVSDNICKSNCIFFLCYVVLKIFWLACYRHPLSQLLCPLLVWISVCCSRLHYEILSHLLLFRA